jgi:hypothetical protein
MIAFVTAALAVSVSIVWVKWLSILTALSVNRCRDARAE